MSRENICMHFFTLYCTTHLQTKNGGGLDTFLNNKM